MTKDKTGGKNNISSTFPNFKKLLDEVRENLKEFGEEQRKIYLNMLANHHPHNLENLSKKEIEFLVNQTSHLCKEIAQQFPDETTPFTAYNYDFLYSFLSLKKYTYESFISSFSEKEKETVLSHLSSLYVQFLDIYEEGKESWIFQNKTYRVFELLQEVDEFSLFRLIQERNPEHWEIYSHLYHTLLKEQPNHEIEPFYLYIQKLEEDEDEEGIESEVFGYSKESLFAEGILFAPLSDWLSYYIASDNLKDMSKEEVLYAILWEIFLSSLDEK